MLTATELTSKKEYSNVTLTSINTPLGIAHQIVSDGIEVAVLYNAQVAFIKEDTFIITGYVKISIDDSILNRQKWVFTKHIKCPTYNTTTKMIPNLYNKHLQTVLQ